MDFYCLRDNAQSLHFKGFHYYTQVFFLVSCLYDPEAPLVAKRILLPFSYGLFIYPQQYFLYEAFQTAASQAECITFCSQNPLPEFFAPIVDPVWFPLPS